MCAPSQTNCYEFSKKERQLFARQREMEGVNLWVMCLTRVSVQTQNLHHTWQKVDRLAYPHGYCVDCLRENREEKDNITHASICPADRDRRTHTEEKIRALLKKHKVLEWPRMPFWMDTKNKRRVTL